MRGSVSEKLQARKSRVRRRNVTTFGANQMQTYRIILDGDLFGFEILRDGKVVARRVGFHDRASAMFAAQYFGE